MSRRARSAMPPMSIFPTSDCSISCAPGCGCSPDMARDPRVTPEQRAEENSVRFGMVGDAGLIILLVLAGILGGSLAISAEAIRAALPCLAARFSFLVSLG